jgi:hypothetical protein
MIIETNWVKIWKHAFSLFAQFMGQSLITVMCDGEEQWIYNGEFRG